VPDSCRNYCICWSDDRSVSHSVRMEDEIDRERRQALTRTLPLC